MAALGSAKAHTLNMQLWITERNIDQMYSITGSFCFTHEREGTMAGECALQDKAGPGCEQKPAPHHGLAGSGDRYAGRLFGIERPGNRIWIDHAGLALESN